MGKSQAPRRFGLPNVVSGNWYDFSTLIAVSTNTTAVLTANRVLLLPMYLPPCTFVQLGLGVTSAVASSNMRLGLYADPPVGGTFGAPLVDSGDIATATTGAKTSGAISVPHAGGVIWIAVLPSAGITVTANTLTAQIFPLGQPNQNAMTRNGGFSYDTSYGALPSNFTQSGYITGNYPQVQAKVG